jgi:hypothetical protein
MQQFVVGERLLIPVWGALMSTQGQPLTPPPKENSASKVFEAIKLDFNTIKIIVLTAVVVFVLVSLPLLFILRNFVTFDALDNYLKVTDSVRPKILRKITEELETGYSKNFILDSPHADSIMLFYATKNQTVSLSVDALAIEGSFQPMSIQVNRCEVGKWIEPIHLYSYDLSSDIQKCQPEEPNLNTLRIVLSDELRKHTTLQVKVMVVVAQRLHEHLEESK